MRTLQENGKTFVLVPLKEYQRFREKEEMEADVNAYDAAKALNEEAFPMALFDAIDAGANPVAVFRKHRGMKQVELARAGGVSTAYLSQIESGARAGTVKALKALAEVLNVPMDLLV